MKKVLEFIIIFIVLLVLAMLVKFWVGGDEDALLTDKQQNQEELVMAENENIKVESPLIGQTISSPLKITGEARGFWFFEADFPVVLVDWDGRIVAQGIAQAQDEWMTEDFVPFEAELNFVKPDVSVSNRGALILKKDNPSGLPENDDALEFEIFFE